MWLKLCRHFHRRHFYFLNFNVNVDFNVSSSITVSFNVSFGRSSAAAT